MAAGPWIRCTRVRVLPSERGATADTVLSVARVAVRRPSLLSAPLVQRLEPRRSNPMMWVRFLQGAQFAILLD